MAEQPKPGQGAIVRADFGGGIDQTSDAWRVPPSQLSSLVNGRLERVGSVRKRTGYQPVDPPKPSGGAADAGAPIAALAVGDQTVVLDRARDSTLDQWAHRFPTIPSLIANECGYVARNYTPSTASATNGWTTTGPASDVIGDVIVLDGNAGNVCECVDYGAAGNWIFVTKVTAATSAASSTTLTLSQYDATSGALVSEWTQTFSGGAASANAARVYPKILVYPTLNRIVLCAAYNSAAGQATAQFRLFSYAATGLALVTTIAPAGAMSTIDYFDVTAYPGVAEARHRPVCPFDVCKSGGTAITFAGYTTGTGIRTETFAVSAVAITSVAAADHAPAGMNALQALSIESTSQGAAIVGVAVPFNGALVPPYLTGNFQCPLVTIFPATCALVAFNLNAVVIPTAGAIAVPGRLTVGEYQALDASESRVCGFVEVQEYAVGLTYGHRLVRVGMGFGNVTAADVTTFRSYAIPAGRIFPLSYFTTVASTDRVPARLPLVVGSSQQVFDGRNPLTNQAWTDYVGNYSSPIGTQILVGTEEMCLTSCNGALQTYGARLQPCPPPHAFMVGDTWYAPHLVAVDGANGFGIAVIALRRRAPGDVLSGSFASQVQSAGGILQTNDGERFAETVLVDRPNIGALVPSAVGAVNDFQPGDYLIYAVATYRDNAGNLHRSTPSDPYRFAQAAAPNTPATWTIWCSYQSYTNRNDVQIEFYVTETNGTIARFWFASPNVVGSPYFAVTRSDTTVAGGTGLPALDAASLYTAAGALPYVPVPSCRFATLFKNRLIVGGADDKRSIYYSNAPQAYVAPSFAIGSVLRMEHETGCTAAGNVNDKLILFSANGTYAVFGQFRDDEGNGNALSELESLHDYIGCTQPVSCVSIPPGLIFFANDRRFYMIDERLQLLPIGLRVQDFTVGNTFQRFDVVQAAVHIEKEREVRFFMYDSLASTATILVYNYQVDQWSQDAVNVSGGPPGSWSGGCYSSRLACFVPTLSGWVSDNGTTYRDDTSWITLIAVTAWIQPGGSQDYARFRYAQLLGRTADPHDLTMRVYTDFDEANVRAIGSWTAAQLAPVSNTVWPEQVRLQVGTQKTQAVKIQINDADSVSATTGAGPQLVGLALEVLPLGGMRRLPATRKA